MHCILFFCLNKLQIKDLRRRLNICILFNKCIKVASNCDFLNCNRIAKQVKIPSSFISGIITVPNKRQEQTVIIVNYLAITRNDRLNHIYCWTNFNPFLSRFRYAFLEFPSMDDARESLTICNKMKIQSRSINLELFQKKKGFISRANCGLLTLD